MRVRRVRGVVSPFPFPVIRVELERTVLKMSLGFDLRVDLATDPFSSKYLPNGPSRALHTAPLKSDSNGSSNGPAVTVNGHLTTNANANVNANTWGGAGMSKTGTMGTMGTVGSAMGEKSPWKNVLSAPIRDGKSRARSRDYLKQ